MPTLSTAQSVEVSSNPDDTCHASRFIGRPIVIHYTTHSRCYLPLGPAQAEQAASADVAVRVTGSPYSSTDVPTYPDAGISSFVLAPDTDFELVATSTCGDEIVVDRISSRREPAPMLSVSIDASKAIERWQHNPSGENFYQMLVSNPYVGEFEKLYILQQFLNQGQPFDDAYDNGEIPPPDAFRETPREACNCVTMETILTRDADAYENCDVQFPGFLCTLHTTEDDENYWYEIHYDSWVEGPAKFERMWGGSKRCANTSYNKMDKSRIGISFLNFSMSCADGEWQRADCACEMPVSVSYSYLSNLSAKAKKFSNWDCDPIIAPNRKAEAYADDAAIFMRLPSDFELNNGTFEFDTLHRRTLFSGCGQEINLDVVGDFAGLIVEGLKLAYIITQGNDTTGIGSILNTMNTASTFDSIKTHLVNMVTNPWIIAEGDCTNISDQMLIAGERNFTFSPDEPLKVALITKSRVRVGGVAYKDTEAKVVSGYRLSGVVKKQEPKPTAPYCCTPALASYILGSMGDTWFGGNLPPSLGSLQNGVGNHLMEVAGTTFSPGLAINANTGGYRITNEVGAAVGRSVNGCKTISTIGDRTMAASESELGSRLVAAGDALTLLRSETSSPAEYRLFDTNGRVLAQGKCTATVSSVHPLETLQPGMYFVTIYDGRNLSTLKYIHTR
jgi:hypothetical protein